MTKHWVKIAVFLALTAIACDEDEARHIPEDKAASETAKTECGLLYKCGCEDLGYANTEDCLENRRSDFESVHKKIKELRLIYDGDCLGAELEALDEQECALPAPKETETKPDCRSFCLAYHGESEVGASCSFVAVGALFSNCAKGLVCDGRTCQQPCDVGGDENGKLAPGEPCQNQVAEMLGQCEEGLFCDADGTGTCISFPLEGEPCPTGDCARDLWCRQVDAETGCVAKVAIGGPCTDNEECLSSYCQDNACAEVPKLNEACYNLCEEGLLCIGDICSEGPKEDESCFIGNCAEGLVCKADFCRLPPPLICAL